MTSTSTTTDIRQWGLAALLTASTAAHVLWPEPFRDMVPAWVPGGAEPAQTMATIAEGVAALLLWRRGTARAGGWLALAIFVGVFPANVEEVRQGGYDAAGGWLASREAALLRLPLQLPLIWWAWRVARGDGRGA